MSSRERARSNEDANRWHQQYLSNQKNPYGYCNHGPNGLTCPVGVAKVSTVHD